MEIRKNNKDMLELKQLTDKELRELMLELDGKLKNNKGIEVFNNAYILARDNKTEDEEQQEIIAFLGEFSRHVALKKNMKDTKIFFEFINYGSTELVFVMEDNFGNRNTVLVKQPAIEFGIVKKEADNLCKLHKKDKSVVAPTEYFARGENELYVTPYINQARCIASDEGVWGMYVPEPEYRFVKFTKNQEHIVNQCMIAKLVMLYDHERGEGVARCKLGGGDFMLDKGWENKPLSIDSTLKSLKLIAARDTIKIGFDEYLELLVHEFTQATINKKHTSDIEINMKARAPMQEEDIKKGINLAKEMMQEM